MGATIFGYITLKDTDFLPPTLGGKGSIYNTFKDFPYITPPPLYRYYFTGTLGYHIGDLFHHTLYNNDGTDYMDLLLHHLVTIYLYTFSYMTNLMAGPVIALIHDIGDIGLTWTRFLAESRHNKFAGYSFIVTLISWLYTRLIILPHAVYVNTIHQEVYSYSPYL